RRAGADPRRVWFSAGWRRARATKASSGRQPAGALQAHVLCLARPAHGTRLSIGWPAGTFLALVRRVVYHSGYGLRLARLARQPVVLLARLTRRPPASGLEALRSGLSVQETPSC